MQELEMFGTPSVERKAVVSAPGRSVNLDGDGKRFLKKVQKVDIETA